MPERRQQWSLIDREIQTALLVRVTSYWLFCLVTIGAMLVFGNAAFGPPRGGLGVLADVIERYSPAMVASLAILPIVLIDALRLSHRFVGPVARVRDGLRQLAEGKRPEQLKVRDGDFLAEMASEFNRAAEQIEATHEGLVSARMSNSLT